MLLIRVFNEHGTIIDFGRQIGDSFTWIVNVPAGTTAGIKIQDSTRAAASTAPFVVQAGGVTRIVLYIL
ncbi:hypothetical protein BDQ17DRAFT_1435888 [Cyathus striatus]|nr:hypothetical protein BDQ17DRAFT_1435888 [Cyathus striatus]